MYMMFEPSFREVTFGLAVASPWSWYRNTTDTFLPQHSGLILDERMAFSTGGGSSFSPWLQADTTCVSTLSTPPCAFTLVHVQTDPSICPWSASLGYSGVERFSKHANPSVLDGV